MFPEIARVLFGLLAVIGLIGLAAYAARKAGLASMTGGLSRHRRLALVETLALDARRRIAIIKCDDREHLVILGPAGETVVARDMEAAAQEDERPAQENPFPTFIDTMRKLKPVNKEDAKDAA